MAGIPGQEISRPLSVLFIGAHPDDADIEFGGTAIQYLQSGHRVSYLTLTNGDAGHYALSGAVLARRRYQESQAVAQFLGITYRVLDNHDAELQATIENRKKVIQFIREVKADLIITHRPNDYHADHRMTSLLVQDAAYLVRVPNVLPFVPRLEVDPVILYHQDQFRKPTPFVPEIIVDITDVVDRKMEALSHHESQVFEWIPFVEGYLQEVPQERSDRLPWLKTRWAEPVPPDLRAKVPASIQYVETFERCEYGGKLDHETARILIPFGIINF